MTRKHLNYYRVEADSYREFGQIKGELFRQYHLDCVDELTDNPQWRQHKTAAEKLLALVKIQFPDYFEELMGVSDSTDIDVVKLWGLCIEDELDQRFIAKCTSLLPEQKKRIAHSEDWDAAAQDGIVILHSTIKDQVLFDLHYIGTLGGNAFSINSSGLVQAINSLPHSDWQLGVPKNVLCRQIAELENMDQIQPLFTTLVRSSGYHHLIYDLYGRYLSIESSAKQYEFFAIEPPFVHTNHYLGKLSTCNNTGEPASYQRYELAHEGIRSHPDVVGLCQVLSDDSRGQAALRNPRTIAQVIADFDALEIQIWLRREQALNWVSYPIDFLLY